MLNRIFLRTQALAFLLLFFFCIPLLWTYWFVYPFNSILALPTAPSFFEILFCLFFGTLCVLSLVFAFALFRNEWTGKAVEGPWLGVEFYLSFGGFLLFILTCAGSFFYVQDDLGPPRAGLFHWLRSQVRHQEVVGRLKDAKGKGPYSVLYEAKLPIEKLLPSVEAAEKEVAGYFEGFGLKRPSGYRVILTNDDKAFKYATQKFGYGGDYLGYWSTFDRALVVDLRPDGWHSTLCHEFTHVWVNENQGKGIWPTWTGEEKGWLEEGLCDYVGAYLATKSSPPWKGIEMKENGFADWKMDKLSRGIGDFIPFEKFAFTDLYDKRYERYTYGCMFTAFGIRCFGRKDYLKFVFRVFGGDGFEKAYREMSKVGTFRSYLVDVAKALRNPGSGTKKKGGAKDPAKEEGLEKGVDDFLDGSGEWLGFTWLGLVAGGLLARIIGRRGLKEDGTPADGFLWPLALVYLMTVYLEKWPMAGARWIFKGVPVLLKPFGWLVALGAAVAVSFILVFNVLFFVLSVGMICIWS